jgi:DNA polymerase-3 subunit delta'
MISLLIHPQTRTQLEQFTKHPVHAVMLYGPGGAGKATLAQELAATILGKTPAELPAYPYFTHITPEKGSVTIESIREATGFLRLKTLGTMPLRRILIVEDAHLMTIEAQNAFLKTLEEPPQDTVIILTSSSLETVLPTIRSRTTALSVLPLAKAQVHEYFTQKGHKSADIDRAYALGNGLPGLLTALLTSPDGHELLNSVNQAKQLLTSDVFSRLQAVELLSKDKPAIPPLLAAMKRIARTALEQAAAAGKTPAVTRWHHILKQLHRAEQALARNANAKLVLTDLLLNL